MKLGVIGPCNVKISCQNSFNNKKKQNVFQNSCILFQKITQSFVEKYLLFNILTWFMNQVYLEKNIDDLIKEIDLFCCFKMCRLKTITFKLSNNIRKIYIFFHVNTTSRRKCSSFFPLRDKYICALWICPVCCKTYPRPWRIMQPCVFPCRRIV